MDSNKNTKEIDDLSTLPNIVFKILELTADKNSGAEDLVKVIQSDPSITAKILRMVNAPYYAIASEIYDVKKAIVRLGFRAVREISLTISVCDLFKSDSNIPGYKRLDLWEHLIGVAILSKMISERLKLSFSSQVFSAGLLHDIGIILMDQYHHDDFIKMMALFQKSERCMCLCEKEVLSFGHEDLAYNAFKKSEIPTPILDVMKNHHDPRNSKDFTKLNSLVYIADKLCSSFQIGLIDNCEIDKDIFVFCLKQLNLNTNDIEVFLEEFPEALKNGVMSYSKLLR
ncbi:MAG: hypothetical protein COB02_11520 [Candidatus Cloacimonadota bacterium]|nr:MAG: hypothetical protein COB02_11520 [Candidatus Cloacimonadota bacterium]